MAQWVKNPPAVSETQEMQVQSLSQEDPLEKETWQPLQYFCLENPTDSGAWQATVHGVAESRTHLNHVSTHTCVHNGITTPETNTTPQINCISIKFFSKQVGLAGPRVSDSQPVAKRGAGWGSHRADCLLHVGGRIGR